MSCPRYNYFCIKWPGWLRAYTEKSEVVYKYTKQYVHLNEIKNSGTQTLQTQLSSCTLEGARNKKGPFIISRSIRSGFRTQRGVQWHSEWASFRIGVGMSFSFLFRTVARHAVKVSGHKVVVFLGSEFVFYRHELLPLMFLTVIHSPLIKHLCWIAGIVSEWFLE